MPECEYCDESFGDEESYLQHLMAEHDGELSRIDQRRVESYGSKSSSDSGTGSSVTLGMAGLGLIMLLAVVLVGYIVISDGGSGDEPTAVGSVHEHGTMEISIDGEQLNLTDPPFASSDEAFHFHGNEQATYGEYVWHKHARDVTLQYALETLGIDVTDDGTELSYDGETYRDSDEGTTVEIEVDGESVDPGTYEVGGVGPEEEAAAGEGDDIVVTVATGA